MLEIFVHMILRQIDISLQFLFSILHYVLTWTQKYPPKIDLDISMVYFRGIISHYVRCSFCMQQPVEHNQDVFRHLPVFVTNWLAALPP